MCFVLEIKDSETEKVKPKKTMKNQTSEACISKPKNRSENSESGIEKSVFNRLG